MLILEYIMDLSLLGLLFVTGVIVELCMYVAWHSRALRTLLAGLCILGLSVSVGAAMFLGYWYALLPLAVVHLYRLFNLFRVAEGRMNTHHLRRVTFLTSYRLIATELIIIGLAYSLRTFSTTFIIGALMGVLCAVAVQLVLIARRRLSNSYLHATDRDHHATPTVTVAIPARNETKDLEECLQSLVRSNYSKLEILVLDDCSQGRRTPEIIRSFAQNGVRFLQGESVRDYWLAKNQAYDTLTDHASGDVLIFCGVDTRFEPDTIQALVDQLVARKKDMLSILPFRARTAVGRPWRQAARYLREFLAPAALLGRPPVLSTCWVIHKSALKKHGLFDAVRRSVEPEGYFARQLAHTDAYEFIRSTENIGLSSVKSAKSQYQTALRTVYPLLHKQPERVLLFSILVLLLVYGPYVVVVLACMGVVPLVLLLPAFFAAGGMFWAYINVLRTTGILSLSRAIIFAPIAAVSEIFLLHVSMVRYEFYEIIWKGRNICEPVMHVLPHLPPLPNDPSPGGERK
jgi:glycosyltransferase involved in cell wall biosynthesis